MALPWSLTHAALFATCRLRVMSMLTSAQMPMRERKKSIYNYIIAEESRTGSNFIIATPEDNPYIVIGAINEIVYMPKHGRGADMLFAYIHHRYGLSEREDITKFIYDTLRHHAIQQGRKAELRRFAAYNKHKKTLYVSARNGSMWQMDGKSITTVRNGEGMFFVDDDGGLPCPNVDIGPHDELINTLTDLNFLADTPSGITPDQQRKALTVWMFMLAFPDLMPTKPMLIFEGATGSGKSTAAQMFQLALLGTKKPMILDKEQSGDFGTMLIRSPIAVFDNTDDYIPWVPDAVCAYATSGMWVKRKLYTDSEEVILRPHSFIVVASKNPASFRREDTADRCILIRLDRWLGFTPMNLVEKELIEKRGRIFGEYLWYLNEIVAEMDREEVADQSHRMADFANFAYVVGRVLKWHIDDVNGLLAALQAERDVFIAEDDSLGELLLKWLRYKTPNRPWNIGRSVTISQLFTELENFATMDRIPFYKSHRLLQQKIRSPHLEKSFIIQTVIDKTTKTKSYQIWERQDSGLTVLPGGKDSNAGEAAPFGLGGLFDGKGGTP